MTRAIIEVIVADENWNSRRSNTTEAMQETRSGESSSLGTLSRPDGFNLASFLAKTQRIQLTVQRSSIYVQVMEFFNNVWPSTGKLGQRLVVIFGNMIAQYEENKTFGINLTAIFQYIGLTHGI